MIIFVVLKLELDVTLRSTACWLFQRFAEKVNIDDYDEYVGVLDVLRFCVEYYVKYSTHLLPYRLLP